MRVILKEDFIKLGKEGDIVDVKDGFARNYLLPKGFAVFSNKHNIDIFNQKKRSILKRQETKKRMALELKEKLDKVSLEFIMQSNDSGKLFHSINSLNISDELLKLGFEIERRRIDIHRGTLKTFGVYDVTIKLYEGISALIKVEIKREEKNKSLKKSKSVEKEV
ncbi:50S ribosomal protein L9 [Borrelia anserina]|uniref:Large ribosomal subunit protein bL9 n=2 Tax=Borrelia anserina TaxID=143 RepID=W5SP27_BORAN|nr:50S ribosomal protein L9 [Borrelia anserina]AHH08074.1 LSU ribosomal protein L9P [Borrelia anserina BA2]AHH08919.1 LSU ribosomal protein L9P [Borrelia anserina BA2]AHX39223.1 ribosomal protein [Borrelia anserina Es]APR64620.1 50S ribosomal protein L9 [Borrelia anserina Es]UPA06534.1 50S ribosomal protein L9 [Borrelia anserina]